MAISSGIPTSFVPKQPVQPTNRATRSSNNIFLIVALVVAGIVAILAIATFVYDRYLTHELTSKQAELAQAESNVDENTVEEFIRLRDRLATGGELLTNHVVLSQFFDVLESLTLQNVRFTSLKLVVAGDHTATLDITGSAKSFNALAAQSNAFATDKRVKRAIFSNITLDTDKVVTFKLNADIDSSLVIAGTKAPTASASVPAPTTQAPVTPVSSTTTSGAFLPRTTTGTTTTSS